MGVLRGGIAALLVVVACCVAVIPLWPYFPAADLDSAWKFAVNVAVAQPIGDVARVDARAFDDPLVGGVHRLRQLCVGDAAHG